MSDLIQLEDFRGVAWDVRPDAPKEYGLAGVRSGGCNMCGGCCTNFVISHPIHTDADLQQVLVWFPLLEVSAPGNPHPGFRCKALGENEGTEEKPLRRCTINDAAERPTFCATYPHNPFTLLPDTCTYRWHSLDGKPLDRPKPECGTGQFPAGA